MRHKEKVWKSRVAVKDGTVYFDGRVRPRRIDLGSGPTVYEPTGGTGLTPEGQGIAPSAGEAGTRAAQQIDAVTRRLAGAAPAAPAATPPIPDPPIPLGRAYGLELARWEARCQQAGIDAHFFSRHGAHLTLRQLWDRASIGKRPDTPDPFIGPPYRERPNRPATQWASDAVQMLVMEEAARAYNAGVHVRGESNVIEFKLPNGFKAGRGYRRNPINPIPVSTDRIRVVFESPPGTVLPFASPHEAALPLVHSSYPILQQERQLNRPWNFTSAISDLVNNRLHL